MDFSSFRRRRAAGEPPSLLGNRCSSSWEQFPNRCPSLPCRRCWRGLTQPEPEQSAADTKRTPHLVCSEFYIRMEAFRCWTNKLTVKTSHLRNGRELRNPGTRLFGRCRLPQSLMPTTLSWGVKPTSKMSEAMVLVGKQKVRCLRWAAWIDTYQSIQIFFKYIWFP